MDRLFRSSSPHVGYVQGMSDLCAPLYIVMAGDEEMTFWCFVEVMNRMVSYYLHERRQSDSPSNPETELLERPEWHEEAAVYAATAN